MRLVGEPLRPGRSNGWARRADRLQAASGAAVRIDPGPQSIVIGRVGSVLSVLPSLPRSALAGVVVEANPADPAPSRPLFDSSLPAVSGIEANLLEEGDSVTVDGSAGVVELPLVVATEVVTSFLRRPDGRFLLLLRSSAVGSYREHWAGVSGYLERETPIERARIEIEEETGIGKDVPNLRGVGEVVPVRSGARVWVAHPFLFDIPDGPIRLNEEHTTFEWVTEAELRGKFSVPRLADALAAALRAARPTDSRPAESG